MDYGIFEEKYNRVVSLNQHYKMIIFEFIRRLEKDNSIDIESDFKEHFLYYKKARKITYEEISSRLSEKGIQVSVDTLKSYSRKDRITIMSRNSVDIKELFNRLSEQNQKAVIYLLDAMYMEQIAPELFEDVE